MAGTAVISTIKHDVTGAAPTFRDGAGNEIGQLVKSWCNYNGSTPGIRSSFNTSSVTKNATGDYTYAFTNSFSDASYLQVTGLTRDNTNNNYGMGFNVGLASYYLTSSARMYSSYAGAGTLYDIQYGHAAFFR